MAPYLQSDIPSSDVSGTSSPPLPLRTLPETEPIAVIGMGCRLPGGVRSPIELWKLLVAEGSGQCDVPASRWNIDSFYHPNIQRPGSMNTKGGYFLNEDVRDFDNGFFGINNLEATYMDPQQRKLLEVCYECFESAGAPMEDVSGANIACYVGNFTTDYMTIQGKDSDHFHRYNATGMGTTILSNRISHVFNMTGPSVVLDTACSSSLYAVHMACAALDAGECDAAIAAGANLIQSPEQHLGTMKAGVLSATSTCHTFDSSADGYGRADGIGAVYLKKLSKALEDNDPIRAIIRGSAVNANGKTNGITLPSADGQEAVIRKAYYKAGLGHVYNETAYVECHGTGTPVGDPIEVEAVSRVFKRRTVDSPLLIGSVKTNLGHSEAASGFSSMFKVALALEKGSIPATIGVRNVNPKIKTDEWGVKIVTNETEWPTANPIFTMGKPTRRAGINSFGYGGANSHVILESADAFMPAAVGLSSEELSDLRPTFILPMSGNSPTSLQGQISNLSSADLNGVNVVDLAYTLGVRRSKLSSRAFVLASQPTLKEDLSPLRVVSMGDKAYSKLPFAFVFTGQGAQWAQMGKELIDEFPSFRQSIAELDDVLKSLPEAPAWTLREAIMDSKDVSQINHVTRSQPVCTAIQIAYVQLLSKWGIQPEAVVGHSSGEIGAAFASGFLTAAEAIIVAYFRGYVIGKSNNPVEGAMMAAGLGKEQSQKEIDSLGLTEAIKVACINSPESVTISGDADGIEKLIAKLQETGVFARKLNTNGRAYHSHHMSPLGQTYEDFLESSLAKLPKSKNPTTAQWISSVTGETVVGAVRPSYWRANLESPVRFSDAVEGVLKIAKYHMVELGPHSALELPIKQIKAKMNIKEEAVHYSAALIRGKNAVTCLLSLIGNLWFHGHDIDFAQVNHVDVPKEEMKSQFSLQSPSRQGKVIPDLPPYAWTYDTLLWSESRQSVEYRNRKHPNHDLLGIQLPAGNGLQTMWKNLVRLDDVPWLKDHKLEETVVFPGAGYIAMAIEAACQVTGKTESDAPSFSLRHIQILKALVLSADKNDAGSELFTSLSPMALTGTTKSKTWYDFEITSFKNEISTTHATGMISVGETKETLEASILPAQLDLESLAIRNWYGQFTKVGLNFGPAFTSLKEIQTPRSKTGSHAIAKTKFLQGGGEGKEAESKYIFHPITIDALLQSGIIASTSGVIKELGPNVPVAIEEATFQTPKPLSQEIWYIDASAEKVGFNASLITASLHDGRGQICMQLKNAHAQAYQGAAQVEEEEDREPMLRVLWKPDISLMSNKSLADHLFSSADTEDAQLASALDIISHKVPVLRVLELNTPTELTKTFLDTLRAGTTFKRFKSYARGHFTENSELIIEAVESLESLDEPKRIKGDSKGQYDLLIIPSGFDDRSFATFSALLAPGGTILYQTSKPGDSFDGYSTIVANATGNTIAVSTLKPTEKSESKPRDILVVEESAQSAFNDIMIDNLSKALGQVVERVSLDKLSQTMIKPKSTIISTIELTRPVMSTLTAEEMVQVKLMTDNALNLVWLTGGNNFQGEHPDFALISGLSRALMLEQPSLKFFTLDLDSSKQSADAMGNVNNVLQQAHQSKTVDFEFELRNEIVHVSRMVPEEHMNRIFREKQGELSRLTPLKDATPARLTIGTVGQFDTLSFVREKIDLSPLAPGYIEIEVKSIGLNAKDFYALAGKVETKEAGCKLECSGVVTKVAASNIQRLSVGDRVVVMSPGHFLTHERFPEWACQKLLDDEDFNVVSTLPVAYATALYALHHRAHIQEGESVLIHSAAGGVGIAAIQVAQLVNADIYATVSTEAKKDYLVKEFGLNRDHIFNSRDSSFLPDVLAATDGRGVDIVLNSLTGDLLHDSWRACAQFGRFVEIGKRDIVDAGKLDMALFERNVTFTAFDMSYLYNESQPKLYNVWSNLVAETMTLYRQKKIRAVEPLKVFDISEITQAYRYFGLGNRMGKVSISLENGESLIPSLPAKFDTSFSPEKTYLLIGCLGGLGRSVSKWMVKRGAKKFVFIGRSGTDRKPARLLVEDLQASGAEVSVVRGDVGVFADVQKAVDLIEGPIGGIIQAAMGLDEALWSAMSNEYWHTGIDPKLVGSWNLYNAVQSRSKELDFFLMTSSVSGSVGTATEGNYCAANYFLDVFARFLKSKGLPGISIGLGMISEVGYLHENPEIEALLLRKGIQAINEDELLQIIDISLSYQGETGYDSYASGHILTGLEPLGMKLLRKAGFAGTNPTMNDPRATLLASALDSEEDSALKSNSGFPPELAAALESNDANSIHDAVMNMVLGRFSNLVLLQLDKIDVNRSLSKFGMDSMLAAEFRTWFYQAFKVDVPFLTLLAETTTLNTLGELVCAQISESL
ncbi:polyketide synthase-nonribosomal peptide synthetase [Coleophoma crateriformis]|uniref:Polyketide synthase-nonribosomal peptide synthetase n=1 Tax=Coleophoma crateriformis TaxID=565419 RepID=A0A3D8SZV8_9HELO|nr:polyketide synthase-nonribosomal peptide synthetase [Coleophoma crateriformis]